MPSAQADFHAQFQLEKKCVDAMLAQPSPSLTHASARLADLRDSFQSAFESLPKYDQSRYEKQLQDLEKQLGTLRGRSQPKSRFAFGKSAAAAIAVSDNSSNHRRETAEAGLSTDANTVVSTLKPPRHSGKLIGLPQAAVLSDDDNDTKGQNAFSLSQLSDCVIDLRPNRTSAEPSTLSALHLANLSRCILIAPVASGSVMLSEVRKCLIIIGGLQFRMHSSSDTTILLHVQSKPIIEDCSALSFGPYPTALSADISHGTSLHEEVQDFGWIREGPSPSWSKISEVNVGSLLNDAISATDGDVGHLLEKYLPQHAVNA